MLTNDAGHSVIYTDPIYRLGKRATSFAAATLLASWGAVAQSATPQIWFGMPGNQMVEGDVSWNRIFFEPDTRWPESLEHVQVISATSNALGKLTEEQLVRVVSVLRQHHIALAIGVLAQNWVHEPPCGHGVEGYSDPPGNAKVIAKLQRAEVQVSYIAMDEPLFFGHYYNGENACHSSIDNVAERVSVILHEYLTAFPGARVIDAEPFPAVSSQADWQNDYKSWAHDFHTAVGQPLTGLYIDINWPDKRWPASLGSVVTFARGQALRVGIIYWGNPVLGRTNDQWLASAEQNFTTIEKDMGIVPDVAVFVSWNKFPLRSITDETGLGEDYLVKRYLIKHDPSR